MPYLSIAEKERQLWMTLPEAVAHVRSVERCELQEAQQLLKQGQVDRALERVDQYLKTKPKDARGRFLRGILLTEQNNPAPAKKVCAMQANTTALVLLAGFQALVII